MNSAEAEVLVLIHSLISCKILDIFFKAVSEAGNSGAVWIILALVLTLIPKTRKCGICISVALILSLVFGNIILKPLIARTRPFDVNPALEIIIKKPRDYSFPSGHTLSSFAAACAIRRCSKRLGTAALVFASLMAFSRIYLCVHYPTDILGGILAGVLLGNLAVPIYNRIFERNKL